MRTVDVSGMDFIKELRLRNWARRNYVSAAIRRPHWHPIVLEEMRQRDEEARRSQHEDDCLGRETPCPGE